MMSGCQRLIRRKKTERRENRRRSEQKKVEKEDKKRKGVAVDGGPAPKKLKVEPTVN